MLVSVTFAYVDSMLTGSAEKEISEEEAVMPLTPSSTVRLYLGKTGEWCEDFLSC
jgi:hypothetical protein